jgi:predicted acyl esterase
MTSIAMERDLAVPMRDGVRLFASLFRPTADGPYPVILSVTPYGKDKLPDRLANFFMRLSGVKFGKLNCSRLTGFESPDPVYWVRQGYAVQCVENDEERQPHGICQHNLILGTFLAAHDEIRDVQLKRFLPFQAA